jgi:hypothetical protein
VEEADQGTAHQGEGQEDIRESQRYFMITTLLSSNHMVLYTYFMTQFTAFWAQGFEKIHYVLVV